MLNTSIFKQLLYRVYFILLVFLFIQGCSVSKTTQPTGYTYINGDPLPDAPELAPRGEYKVGVRTVNWINKAQIDILKSKGGSDPLYDRPLRAEIWYPAIVPENAKELTTYNDVFGSPVDSTRPVVPFSFAGRALRDAKPDSKSRPFPLIIVSHGYPGSRVLLSYLCENLASKGYVVVAIDHTESTHADQKAFQSTLLNRAKDILFVLNQVDTDSKSIENFLSGLTDANNTALIGYSMGGYGVLNAAGAGYSDKLAAFFTMMTQGSKSINSRTTNDSAFKASYDPRIKAVVAFAPWGMQRGIWGAEGLKGLKVPTLFIAGDKDDVSGYEDGTKAIYNGAVNTDRYLLTYENARHNVAPNPPPPQSLKPGFPMSDYYHYAEPAWNERRINNINQHFVTAFLGIHLLRQPYNKYLEIADSVKTKSWPGFKPRASVGLELVHAGKLSEP